MADVPSFQASVSAPKPMAKAQPIERVEIETTDSGGFIVKCYKKPKGKGMMGMVMPSKHVYKDVQELKGFIDEYLGDGPSAAPAAPAAPEAPAMPAPATPADVAAGPVDGGEEEMDEDVDEDAE